MIYRVWNTSYLRKNEVDLQSMKDRGWEFVENCSYSVFRKATCDVDLNDQSFMDNRLRCARGSFPGSDRAGPAGDPLGRDPSDQRPGRPDPGR